MRKLASIQIIREISPIENADAIVRARVLGWNVVVKKDEFKPGDKCIYVEIDSLLPEKPEFEFMRDKKFRVKTIKLRGQISQGICFPMTVLPKNLQNSPEGTDVTEALGIKKWEPYQKPSKLPKSLARFRKKAGLPFPGFIYKTDETRVQILEPLLQKYAGTKMYITEKMDGSSFTFFRHLGNFGVCSRNYELARPGNSWWDTLCTKLKLRKHIKFLEYKFTVFMDKINPKVTGIVRDKFFGALLELVDIDQGVDSNFWDLAYMLDLENKLINTGLNNIALQGEMCGPGIQGNKYKFENKRLFIFQAYYTDKARYATLAELKDIVKTLGLEMAPILDEDFILDHSVDQLVELSIGKSIYNKKTQREGIVVRPLDCKFDNQLSDLNASLVSFKVINPKFNLEHDE